MTPTQRAALAVASSTLIASGIAASNLVGPHEGWVSRAYPDPAHGWAVPTACLGATQGIVKGRSYSDQECMDFLIRDLAAHGAKIAPCLPADIPVKTRAALISFAYNVGPDALCRSTLARKAKAGDLAGACAELSRWTYAGGRQLPGLVKRRAAERAMCEEGLR